MNPNLKELINALPREIEGTESIGNISEQRLREIFADLAERPVPVGSLHRLWSLGDLSAQIALAYLA